MNHLAEALIEALDEHCRGLALPTTSLSEQRLGGGARNAVPRVAARDLTRERFAEFVLTSQPVVVTGAMDNWLATQRWSGEYLSDVAGDARVTVSVTPSGWADALHPVALCAGSGGAHGVRQLAAPPIAACVCSKLCPAVAAPPSAGGGSAGDGSGSAGPPAAVWFVKPEERNVTLREAIAMVRDSGRNGEVAYLSFQNDSLRAQMPQLLAELRPAGGRPAAGNSSSNDDGGGGSAGGGGRSDGSGSGHRTLFPFTPWIEHDDGAGGLQLEAINLWVGTRHSTTALHKDHYDNVYAVIAGGAKTFTLLPPTDVLFAYEREFPSGTFVSRQGAAAVAAAAVAAAAAPVRAGAARHPSPQQQRPPLADVPAAPPDDAALAAAGCTPGWAVAPDVLLTYTPSGCSRGQAVVPWIALDPAGTPGACCRGGGRGGARVGGAAAEPAGGPAPGGSPPRCPVLPLASHASPVVVTLQPGELLFLPALWHHQVAHEAPTSAGDGEEGDGVTIAVNAWYNMRHDTPAWLAYQLARAAAPLVQAPA